MATYIGNVLYESKAIPATNDTAGFEALTWVKVNGVQSLPKPAVTHTVIEVDDLESGFTLGEKGAASGASSEISCHAISGDAGQADLILQAGDNEGLTSFKIVTKPSGTGGIPATGDKVLYAQGFVHSYTPNDNNVSTYDGFTVSFRQNAAPVYSTEP